MRPIGESPLFKRVLAQADRFAATRVPVLLVGETGTGKELFARYLHARSGRTGEFVDLNCGTFPRDMVESLLFGHRRGAFTGAVEDSAGLVACADGGTLFLDELPSLPLEGQAKLLRVLEMGEVRRLGDTDNRPVDFRLIGAVQEDFAERVRVGLFRRDLYHRIAGVRIELPPLRARPDDIVLLAEYFAAALERVLAPEALALLRSHRWPGNARELRTVIERAAILCDTRVLSAAAIASALDQQRDDIPELGMRTHLLQLCAANDWNPERIAQVLAVSRATLYRRLRVHGIRLREVSKSQLVSPSLETS